MTDANAMNVLLVHGLYMNRLSMQLLGRRLAERGFRPHYFGYYATQHSLREHAARLAEVAARLQPCHYVGHSLGGLLLRQLAADFPELMQGRVVTLGSPHRGSIVARRIRERHWPLLGQSWHNALDGRLSEQPLPVPCLSIAGVAGFGLGKCVCRIDGDNDGTVAVAETLLPCSKSLIVPTSHGGLLINRQAAEAVAEFWAAKDDF